MSRLRRVLLALLLGAAVAGCAALGGDRTLLVTGETLDAVGQQFVRTGQLYNRLLDEKLISEEQYREWARFAKRFQVAYPVAVDLWKEARVSTSVEDERRALEVVLTLKNQLLTFVLGLQRQLAGGL